MLHRGSTEWLRVSFAYRCVPCKGNTFIEVGRYSRKFVSEKMGLNYFCMHLFLKNVSVNHGR